MSESVTVSFISSKYALYIIWIASHIHARMWTVEFTDEFDPEYDALDPEVQDELLAQLKVVEQQGPLAKRPRVDTLKGSKHANMKELRFSAAGGEWRAAFAFDAERKAIYRSCRRGQVGRR